MEERVKRLPKPGDKSPEGCLRAGQAGGGHG